MNLKTKLFAIGLALVAFLGLLVTPASARGGGSNFMQSEGYQRALRESRQRYYHSYQQPVVVYPARSYHRRHWRHRHYR